MRNRLIVGMLLTLCLCLCGCQSIALKFISNETLLSYGNAASVKAVADVRAELSAGKLALQGQIDAATKALKDENAKLKEDTSSKWVGLLNVLLVILVIAGIVFFAASAYIALKVDLTGGGALGVASLVLGGTALAVLLKAKVMAIAVIWGLGAVAVIGAALGAWMLYRKYAAHQATLDAIVPAIETAEPKKEGDAPSGPIKAAIQAQAEADKTLAAVTSVIDETKLRLGM